MTLHFVHGPPGTGKTQYLTRQCERAANKHGTRGVAIASLTRTAAHEIAGRTNIDDDLAGTLHAHAYRALDQPELAETPEGIREFNNAHPAQRLTSQQRLEDTLTTDDTDTPGDNLHNQVMTHRARMTPRNQWTPAQQDHDQVWTHWKREAGRLDFTDLIEQCLRDHIPHPTNPRVWLLDEAQDFSPLELQLARTWLDRADTAIVVADPDQAIYGWRGADPQALYGLPITDTRALQQSHRVPRTVHQLADQWINQITDRHPVTYQPTNIEGTIRHSGHALRNPDTLLGALDEQLAGGGTVMVLASCAYMLTPLITALRRHGTPFHNPYRPDRGQWNPLRGARRLKAFLRPSPRVWGERSRAWTWDDLWAWIEPLNAKCLPRGSKTQIELRTQPDRFGQTQGSVEVPWDKLLTLLGATSSDHPALRLDTHWYRRNLLASQQRLFDYPLTVHDHQGAGALATEPRLIVGTVHSVKGGQADSVLVAPDLSPTGMGQWEQRGPGRDQITRLIYVALTRARHHVTLLAPSGPNRVPRELLRPREPAA